MDTGRVRSGLGGRAWEKLHPSVHTHTALSSTPLPAAPAKTAPAPHPPGRIGTSSGPRCLAAPPPCAGLACSPSLGADSPGATITGRIRGSRSTRNAGFLPPAAEKLLGSERVVFPRGSALLCALLESDGPGLILEGGQQGARGGIVWGGGTPAPVWVCLRDYRGQMRVCCALWGLLQGAQARRPYWKHPINHGARSAVVLVQGFSAVSARLLGPHTAACSPPQNVAPDLLPQSQLGPERAPVGSSCAGCILDVWTHSPLCTSITRPLGRGRWVSPTKPDTPSPK